MDPNNEENEFPLNSTVQGKKPLRSETVLVVSNLKSLPPKPQKGNKTPRLTFVRDEEGIEEEVIAHDEDAHAEEGGNED